MRRRRVNEGRICKDRARALSREVSNEQFVGCRCRATIGAGGRVALSHRIGQSLRMSTRTELCVASAARPRANPSFHTDALRLAAPAFARG